MRFLRVLSCPSPPSPAGGQPWKVLSTGAGCAAPVGKPPDVEVCCPLVPPPQAASATTTSSASETEKRRTRHISVHPSYYRMPESHARIACPIVRLCGLLRVERAANRLCRQRAILAMPERATARLAACIPVQLQTVAIGIV